MKHLRDPHWALVLVFLAIIGTVPLIQMMVGDQESQTNGLELFSEFPSGASLRAFEEDLEESSWAARLSRASLQPAQFTWLKDGGEKVVFGSSGWYFYKPGVKYMLARPLTQRQLNATNDPVAAIVHFRDQLASWGIHLLVLPIPNKESVYPDRLTPAGAQVRGILAPRTRDVLEKLRSARVEIVDLFEEFNNAREQGDASEAPLYLAQDTHWSPAGVALAAKAVARRLQELGWVQPGEMEYEERPAPVRRLGDILRMMQLPSIERAIAPESIPSVQVVRRDNKVPYQDEAGAEILVLGDSFMRIYQEDQPRSAGFIAHLARELKQPMLSLINDGGGATLVREELCARPVFLQNKKVVIWEFVERDIALALKGWVRTQLPPRERAVAAGTRGR